MKLPRHKVYKESGISWLGEIPAHWWPSRLRFVATFNPSKSEISELSGDMLASFLPMEAIGDDGSIDLSRDRCLQDIDTGFTYFRDNDVLIAKITPCFENGKGAVAKDLKNGIGFGTTELTVVRPQPGKVDSGFLQWLFTSVAFRKLGEATMYGAGGQKRVPDNFVRDFKTAIPGLSEQQEIARFLDREIGKIDAVVAEQEKLIALLKEKRQAVISHVVTKGLNPSVPMKDSGIEWLGEIPAHWEITPLMRLTDDKRPIMYGIVLPGPDVEEGVPIVKGGDVKPGRLKRELLCRTTAEIEEPYARARLKKNDVVYSIRGTIGEVELVPEELTNANITQDVARVSTRVGVDCVWLVYALRSNGIFAQLRQRSLGAAVPGVNIFDLKRARIPVPPNEEQTAIANYLTSTLEKLAGLIGEAEKAINLLKEHRSALISAAVTGKIDVRGLMDVDSAREAPEAA